MAISPAKDSNNEDNNSHVSSNAVREEGTTGQSSNLEVNNNTQTTNYLFSTVIPPWIQRKRKQTSSHKLSKKLSKAQQQSYLEISNQYCSSNPKNHIHLPIASQISRQRSQPDSNYDRTTILFSNDFFPTAPDHTVRHGEFNAILRQQ